MISGPSRLRQGAGFDAWTAAAQARELFWEGRVRCHREERRGRGGYLRDENRAIRQEGYIAGRAS